MKKDLKNNLGIINIMEPTDLVATDTGTSLIDTAGYEGVQVAVQVGALTGVDGSSYLTLKLQESDATAATGFTDVAAADMIGAFTVINAATKDSVVQTVGYIGTKKYIRVLCDYTGVGITAGIVGAIGIVGYPASAPVTAPAAVAAT